MSVGTQRTAVGESPATAPVVAMKAGPPSLQARIGLAFGLLATVALPLAYQWTFRPSTRPPGSEALIQLMELAGILAASVALLLGRRARATGDRSTGAIWAPRLGGAAIVGYAMTIVVLMSRSS
ncbi:MAG: hypothetical protein ABIZ52_01440 [Candidatus Limnocylindrales bacterium]